MTPLAIILTTFAVCFVLAAILAWRTFVFGIRHGVRQMHREAMALILAETEKTKIRSAGLIAMLDTRVAMLKAMDVPIDKLSPFRSPPKDNT